MQVAKTILAQMGGMARLNVFTGAKGFVATENSVRFRVNRGDFMVVLDPDDTYTVTYKGREYTGVYCDQLVEVFERFTGMYLSF